MSKQELEQFSYELVQRFPDLPNPEREPKRFAWYVKLFKYLKAQETK